MSEQIRQSFYQSRLHDFAMSNFTVKEDDKDLKRQKEISKNPISQDIIEKSLHDFGKTAKGPHYNFLSFTCQNQQLYGLMGLEKFIHLQYVNVSNNKLITIKHLSSLKNLIYLDCSHNNLKKLLDLKEISDTLEHVEAGFNKISVIPDLSQHKQLKILNLESNLIKKIEEIQENQNLQTLNLKNNQIDFIENLDGMNLTELNLQGNKINQIFGFDNLPLLRKLDLSHNNIVKLSGLSKLSNLRELKLSNNKIKKINQLKYIKNLDYLAILNLENNEIQQKKFYKYQVLYQIPNLRIFDNEETTPQQYIKSGNFYGQEISQRKQIFNQILPEEEFVDRRIHVDDQIEIETDSDNDVDTRYIDEYNNKGTMTLNTSKLTIVKDNHQYSRTEVNYKSLTNAKLNTLPKTVKSHSKLSKNNKAISFKISNRQIVSPK